MVLWAISSFAKISILDIFFDIESESGNRIALSGQDFKISLLESTKTQFFITLG